LVNTFVGSKHILIQHRNVLEILLNQAVLPAENDEVKANDSMEVLILMHIRTTLTTHHATYVYSNKRTSFQYCLTITFAFSEQDTINSIRDTHSKDVHIYSQERSGKFFRPGERCI